MQGWSASLPGRAAQAIHRRLRRALFLRRVRGVLATPALRPGGKGLTIVTMLGTRDVLPYLLAVKSVQRHLPPARLVVLDDGSLTEADRGLLGVQLGRPEIRSIAAVPNEACPRGGCWERLLHILDLTREGYVIQLDSDVLANGPLPEVVAAVAANRSFTLTSDLQYGIVTLEEAAAALAGCDPAELQYAAEQTLPRLPPGLGRLYVRGSAGFAGFAQGAAGRAEGEAFSRAMAALMGVRWSEWGTEQVASNYLVANAPGAVVLPWPKYRCFYGAGLGPETVLAHFVGTWRYEAGVYAARARQVIADLAPARA
jgi:hypothetical protein